MTGFATFTKQTLALVLTLLVGLVLTSCGEKTTPKTAATRSATPTAEPTPQFRQLSKPELKSTLMTIKELPAGYAKDPDQSPSNKTYCNYKPVATPNTEVIRQFTKGGGFSTQFLHFVIRQFDSTDTADQAFTKMEQVLQRCRQDKVDGETIKYSLMSAPEIGDRSLGLKGSMSDQVDLMQYHVLVGPSIVSAAGAGIMNLDADEATRLLEKQVQRYQEKARS
ncbi:MAG TPA: hypothetical protein PKM12_07945 [Marmoricola sp.]|nr:hypothetical protein [Marmoricola sp.]